MKNTRLYINEKEEYKGDNIDKAYADYDITKRQKQLLQNKFYSLSRHIESFSEYVVTDYIKDLCAKYKEILKLIKQEEKYFFVLKLLIEKSMKNIITKEDMLYSLVQIIDPNLDMFKMVKDKKSKEEIIEIFGFYDPRFIKLELLYYRTFEDKENKKINK